MRRLTKKQQSLVISHVSLAKFAARKYGSGIEFDEALSEAYIALCRAAALFDSSRGVKFSTYAVKAMVNELNAFRRKRKVRVEEDFSAMEYDVLIENKDSSIDIDALLKELSPVYRGVLLSRFGLYDQPVLTQSQIATILGVHRVTVSRYQMEALRKLRTLFLGEGQAA